MPTLAETYPEEWFDRRAKSKKGPHVSAQHLAELVYKKFKPRTALDLGAGTCAFANRLGELGAQYVQAVDGSPFNGKFAKHCKYLGHDLRKPLDLGKHFDLVTSWDTIEHIEKRGEKNVIRTVVEHAKPAGDVLLSIDPSEWGHMHVNCHGKKYWVEKFTKAGLIFDPELTKEMSRKILANEKITSKWYGWHVYCFHKP